MPRKTTQTGFSISLPSKAFKTFIAAISHILVLTVSVANATCGVTTTKFRFPHWTTTFPPHLLQLGCLRSSWSCGRGSGVVTSSPAAKIFPVFRASRRASWSTISPLATLTKIVLLLILLKALALKRWRVSSFRGHVMKIKSLFSTSLLNETYSAPRSFPKWKNWSKTGLFNQIRDGESDVSA